MSRLVNRSTNRVLVERAEIARNIGRLLLGLIGRKAVPTNYALGFPKCDWVHTWGMRVPLDVLFCDGQGVVLHILNRVPPFRILPRVKGVAITWETGAGGFAPAFVAPGDTVIFE